MLHIYLARHGQDQDNADSILNGHRDTPLTQRGIQQANQLAKDIKQTGLTFDTVYASPLQRAYNTAKIVAESTNAPAPIPLDLLIERDFGIMTGKSHTEIESICAPEILKTDTVTYFLSPQDAETFPDLLERANQLFKYINQHHRDGNVLLVSHGDIGKMIYCAYYQLDWQQVLQQFHFGNSEMLLLSTETKPENAHVFQTQQYNL